MFKIEMTFLVPNDKLKFKRRPIDGRETSDESYSHGYFIRTEPSDGVKNYRSDIPEIIDGAAYDALSEKQQETFQLVEGEHLFAYKSSYCISTTDEFLLARSCAT